MKNYLNLAWRDLALPVVWAPAVSGTFASFLIAALFGKLGLFAPWSAALAFFSALMWPLSFESLTWRRGLQAAVIFAGFMAIFLAVQLCYFFTAIPSLGPLISPVPILFVLFVCVALAFIWPALFFLREISVEELTRIFELALKKPKESGALFGTAFAPLGLSGLLYVWAHAAVFSLYGPIGIYAQVAALWPFLLLISFSGAFFLQIAKRVKR